MERERDLYARLLEYAEEKKEVLVKNDFDGINRVLTLETETMERIADANKLTNEVLERIAQKNKLAARPDLSAVIALVDDENEKEELRATQNAFQSLVAALKMKNDTNQKLLETQLKYNEFFLNMLTQQEGVGDLYGNDGLVDEDRLPRRVLIDTQV
jgi:flagellar biosynthesis/type III secretory pathway chaperone